MFKWGWIKTKGYRNNLFFLLIITIIISLLNVLNSASLKLVLDIADRKSNISLWIGMVFPIMVVILTALMKGIQTYLSSLTQLRISGSIKENLLEHIEHIPLAEFNKFHSGDLLNRLSDDTTNSAKIFPVYVLNFITGAFSCIFAFIYAFHLSWKLTIIVILLAPGIVIWSKLFIPKINNYENRVRICDSTIKSFLQDQLTDIISLKTFGYYKHSINKFSIQYKDFTKESLRKIIIEALMWQGGSVIGFLSFATTVCLGAYLCLQGEITLGTIVGYAQLLNYIIWPFTQAMEIISNLQTGFVSTRRITDIMDIPVENNKLQLQLKENKINIESTVDLVLENVCFEYVEKDRIINNLSVRLSKGQLVGIFGESGQGKSTLLKLLLALYQPTKGSIKIVIDGIQYSGVDTRSFISYVPQEHMLFSGSIRDNICIGNETATQAEIEEVAKKADIHNFIMTLQNGYETILNEKGNNVSFGQAQRIAIARALLKNSPILLLDEPTASLDKTSEEAVMNILKRESKNRLCILVSHSIVDKNLYNKIIRFKSGSIDIETQ